MNFSIIVATFNSIGTLSRAIESIISQSCESFELIIVDGGSCDGTVELIESYGSQVTHFIPGPDGGIYDGWNKALSLASGDWVYFMGSDDYFAGEYVLEKCLRFAESSDSSMMMFYGRVLFGSGDSFRCLGTSWASSRRSMSNFMSIPHQGLFHSRLLFERFGVFDAKFKILGDYDFMLRVLSAHVPVFVSDLVVAFQAEGGKSSLLENRYRVYLERRLAWENNNIKICRVRRGFELFKAAILSLVGLLIN
jgi:glycosyltransferase involved in cell wall biosynthesis